MKEGECGCGSSGCRYLSLLALKTEDVSSDVCTLCTPPYKSSRKWT